MTAYDWTTLGWTDWVVPSDCYSIDSCWAVGPGGAGHKGIGYGDAGYVPGNPGPGGYGGGSGAVSEGTDIAVTPSETLKVYVGAPGTYSGLYRDGQGWLVLAYGASGQTGGSTSGGVGDSKTAGNNGANGNGSSNGYDGGTGGTGGTPVGPFGGSGGSGGVGGSAGAYNGQPGNAGTGKGAGGGGGGGGSSSGVTGPYSGDGASGNNGYVKVTYTPYVPQPPTVTGLSKTKGRPGGGETVVITGTNFENSVSAVKFGTINATSYTVDSDTQISAVTPQHSPATVDVTVTNVDGTSDTSSADQFTFKFLGGMLVRGPF